MHAASLGPADLEREAQRERERLEEPGTAPVPLIRLGLFWLTNPLPYTTMPDVIENLTSAWSASWAVLGEN
jgi:hypothetical protein